MKTKIEIEKMIVPVYYLPYLINGDTDNLSDEEIRLIEQRMKGYSPLSCEDYTFFSWRNDFNKLGGECTILLTTKTN